MSDSANPIAIFDKDPNSITDFSIDWAASEEDGGPWLDGSDFIVDSVWIVPVGVTEVSSNASASVTTIWLSGGTAGDTYFLVNRITTDQGRVDDATIQINMVEK